MYWWGNTSCVNENQVKFTKPYCIVYPYLKLFNSNWKWFISDYLLINFKYKNKTYLLFSYSIISKLRLKIIYKNVYEDSQESLMKKCFYLCQA